MGLVGANAQSNKYDLNEDGDVNITDVTLLVTNILDQNNGNEYDLNDDEDVNITDVILMVNYILGLNNGGGNGSGNGSNANIEMHRLYGAAKIEDNTYRVKVTLKAYPHSSDVTKAYNYEAIKIELLEGSLRESDLNVTLPRTTNNSITLAKLLKNVEKSYEKGKKLLDHSRVLDENGEPLVLYRGQMSHANTPFVNHGDGIYFTPQREAAMGYGVDHDPIPVFLNARNPYEVDFDGDGCYDDYHIDTFCYGIWQNLGDISGTEYDVAHVEWGGNWCMPTWDDIQELLDYCNHVWTTLNGVNGYKFTGSNGNSIFLPAAGLRWDYGLDDAGSYGDYWSSTQFEGNSGYASLLYFGSDYAGWDFNSRGCGFSVRPVWKE